jgi:hypothetical protein
MNNKNYIIYKNQLGHIISKQFEKFYLIKLDNDAKYTNYILEQYKNELLPNEPDIRGFNLIPINEVEQINSSNLLNYVKKQLSNPNFEKFENLDYIIQTQYNNITKNKNILKNLIVEEKNAIEKSNTKKQNISKNDEFIYIRKLFCDNLDVEYIYKFNDDKLDIDSAEEQQLISLDVKEIMQDIILNYLNTFSKIKESLLFNYDTSILNKNISNNTDNIAIGMYIINIISKLLLNMQQDIKYDNNQKLNKDINIFGWVKFEIIDDYIVITNMDNEPNVINPDIVELNNLHYLYNKEIDFDTMTSIINKSIYDITENNNVENSKINIHEALKILSSSYIINIQCSLNIINWMICRLLLIWFSEKSLKIQKITILINLFKSQENNKIIQPIVNIYPFYGRQNSFNVSAKLNYYLFPYKKLNVNNVPTDFEKIDTLMNYINLGTYFKKYINNIINDVNNVKQNNIKKVDENNKKEELLYSL